MRRTIRAAASWMDGGWLAKRILRAQSLDAVGAVRFHRLSSGRRVYLVQVDGHTYVLELDPRLDRLRTGVQAAMTAAEHRLSAARLLGSDASLMALCRYGAGYAIFEYVEGRHPSYDCPLEDITSIATTYAQVHSVTRSLPGIGAIKGWTLDEYIAAWNAIASDIGSTSEWPQWLLRNRPFDVGTYQLVHGDANRGNVLLKTDGQSVLIDLGGMHFGFPPLELVYLLLYYCGSDAARRMRFIDVYRERLGNLFETWERHAAFWLFGGLMERARYRIASARNRRIAGEYSKADKRVQDARAAVDHATRVAKLFQDGKGQLEEVLDECWEPY